MRCMLAVAVHAMQLNAAGCRWLHCRHRGRRRRRCSLRRRRRRRLRRLDARLH